MAFKVEKIIDGNTIVVNPHWNISGKSGNEVIVKGYALMFSKEVSQKWNDAAENKIANDMAKHRLEILLKDGFIELRTRQNETTDCIDKEGRLRCFVYKDDVDVSQYFVEFNK